MLRVVLLTFCVGVAAGFWGTPDWNHLKVTWDAADCYSSRGFADMPRTEKDAWREGWTMISDCDDTPKFAGKRYVKDGDTAVVLIYDVNGYIAGIQAGFPPQPNNYPSPTLQNHPFVEDDGKQYITVYFTNPSGICSGGRTSDMFESEGTGSDMYIQNGTRPSDSTKVPKLERNIGSTLWTKGHCFRTMGQHYWYNLRKDQSCDEFFPMFLLYNQGILDGFGWAFLANLTTSTRYEHPRMTAFGYFLDPVPDCLYTQTSGTTTMHIYMSDPNYSFC
ncbi:uncharacterized protein [Haliotis cracherodii]|uniref:uncharacterized protein n=1 Tax=Haliotis cracherodii TaxID=6455 RepID=UPI0039E8363C